MGFRFFGFISLVLTYCFCAPIARACSCGGTLEQSIEWADVIFVGFRIGSDPTYNENPFMKSPMPHSTKMKFLVLKTYKGWVPEIVTVATPNDTCKAFFDPSEIRVIVADRYKNKLYTEHCNYLARDTQYIDYYENQVELRGKERAKHKCFVDINRAYTDKVLNGKFELEEKSCDRFLRSYNQRYPTLIP